MIETGRFLHTVARPGLIGGAALKAEDFLGIGKGFAK